MDGMTAMQQAFRRLGIQARPVVVPPKPGYQREAENIEWVDVAGMSDDDLLATMARIEKDCAAITEQLNADLVAGQPRGQAWRTAAGVARGYRKAELATARQEYERRHPPVPRAAREAEAKAAAFEVKAKARTQEATAAHALAMARAIEKKARADEHNARQEMLREQKALRRAEHDAQQHDRNRERARLFLAAAEAVMSKEDRAVIWARARQMFPDAEAWASG